MAFFDNNAEPVAAVAAFLDQFSIANNGDVRSASGVDTFHVTWLHRSLQHKVYDFTSAGDDFVQLSDPNPSTTAAIGQIIQLVDQTPNGFTQRYNIDQAVAERLFGGSVTQVNSTGNQEAWYPLSISGSSADFVEPQVVQNGVQVASFWGTGINQTDDTRVSRVLIKAVEDGVLLDGGRVTVKAHDYLGAFSHPTTTLGLTEAFAFISADSDPFNTTDVATVSAYGISTSEGYNLLDLDGNGNKPYLGEWSFSPRSSNGDLYEYIKYVLSRDSGQTLYGVDSNLWTGRVFEVQVGSGSGVFQQNEPITWAGGSGNLMALDDLDGSAGTLLWLHLQTGVAPVDGEVITGDTSSATTTVGAGGSVVLPTSPNHLGQYTGAWIAARGIGFAVSQVTSSDSFNDLDGNIVRPPNFVSISGTITTVEADDEPHVFATLRSGSSPIYNQHTLSAAAASGDSVITIDGAIPSTTPLSGWVGVMESGGENFVFYEYDSWSGSTFNLTIPLAEGYSAADTLMVAYFYQSPDGATTVKTVSRTLIYDDTPIDVIGWIRQGDEAAPDAFIPFSGQIGAGGFSFSESLQRET